MLIVIPNRQDPTAPPGVTYTAFGWVQHVQVGSEGPSRASGRLVIWLYRSAAAAAAWADPVEVLDFAAGRDPLPPVYPDHDRPGMLSEPEFAIAWQAVLTYLISKLVPAFPGATVQP